MEKQASYKPVKGEIVKLGIFHGIVEDIYFNSTGEYVVKLFLVKNAFQRGSSELHESGKVLGDLVPATIDELNDEIAVRKCALLASLGRFDV